MQSLEDLVRFMREGAYGPPPTQEGPEYARRCEEMARAFAIVPGALETILDLSLRTPAVDYRLPRDGTFENYALQHEGANRLAAAILKYFADGQALLRSPPDHASSPTSAAPRRTDPPGAGELGGVGSVDFRV